MVGPSLLLESIKRWWRPGPPSLGVHRVRNWLRSHQVFTQPPDKSTQVIDFIFRQTRKALRFNHAHCLDQRRNL